MQKCSPNPNARCGFGRRSTRNANGSSNTSSSRFADAKYSATLVAGADRHAAHLAVLGRDAGEVADRADPAQDLLDRVGQQLGLVAQLLPLAAVLGEREQPAADRVARRLVAGFDEQLAVREQLLLGERRAVDLRVDAARSRGRRRGSRRRCSISSREVRVQLAARALDRLARRLARAPELGIVLADHLVGPAEQQLPVGTRARRGSRRSPRAGTARRCARRSRTRRRRRPPPRLVEDLEPRCARCRRWRARTAAA